MDLTARFLDAMAPYGPRCINASRRGSGLNAVWLIEREGRKAILKTYHRRRPPVRTALGVVSHWMEGKTGYSASARRDTERRNLETWNAAGFAVPAVLPFPCPPALPLPMLCIEFVEGRRLADLLADPALPQQDRDAAFLGFLRRWADRHRRAIESGDRRLVQEHASVEHVLVHGDRFTTIDLEVSYRRIHPVRRIVAAEICGYLRSLFRSLPEPEARRLLALTADAYPHRAILETACTTLCEDPNPVARAVFALDRARRRAKGGWDKYRIAGELLRLLAVTPGRVR